MEEVLNHHHLSEKDRTDQRSLQWDEVADWFKLLDVQIRGHQGVAAVRTLRHILTHKRGELRTMDDAEHFGQDDDGWISHIAPLNIEDLTGHMDSLSTSASTVDSAAYAASWGQEAPVGLLQWVEQKLQVLRQRE